MDRYKNACAKRSAGGRHGRRTDNRRDRRQDNRAGPSGHHHAKISEAGEDMGGAPPPTLGMMDGEDLFNGERSLVYLCRYLFRNSPAYPWIPVSAVSGPVFRFSVSMYRLLVPDFRRLPPYPTTQTAEHDTDRRTWKAPVSCLARDQAVAARDPPCGGHRVQANLSDGPVDRDVHLLGDGWKNYLVRRGLLEHRHQTAVHLLGLQPAEPARRRP